jgi:hypothetical protein
MIRLNLCCTFLHVSSFLASISTANNASKIGSHHNNFFIGITSKKLSSHLKTKTKKINRVALCSTNLFVQQKIFCLQGCIINCIFMFIFYTYIFFNKSIIFKAVIAASLPLWPCAPPSLSHACCSFSTVSTPKIVGASCSKFNLVIPSVTLLHT